MDAKGLQLITVSNDKVVLKRGMAELLLTGPDVQTLVESVVRLIEDGASKDEIVEAFPGTLRNEVEGLVDNMLRRRLIVEGSPPPSSEDGGSILQTAFWANFGDLGAAAAARLADARIAVVGNNLISRHLARSLLEMRIGHVQVIGDPVLDNHLAPLPGLALDADGIDVASEMPGDDELAESSMVCATCDFGAPEALLSVSRLALKLRTPFLPVWLAEMVGYIGPLTYPFDTACLRCYQVRTDSNTRAFDAVRAVRRHLSTDPDARYAAGMLPPMPAVAGHIAAMEIAKCLIGFAPADSIGRVIEVNLVSFASTVRRVLKVPRCPDCSTAMQLASRTVTVGPQIPAD